MNNALKPKNTKRIVKPDRLLLRDLRNGKPIFEIPTIKRNVANRSKSQIRGIFLHGLYRMQNNKKISRSISGVDPRVAFKFSKEIMEYAVNMQFVGRCLNLFIKKEVKNNIWVSYEFLLLASSIVIWFNGKPKESKEQIRNLTRIILEGQEVEKIKKIYPLLKTTKDMLFVMNPGDATFVRKAENAATLMYNVSSSSGMMRNIKNRLSRCAS